MTAGQAERRLVLLAAAALAVALVYSLWSARPAWSDVALTLVLLAAVRLTWPGRLAVPRVVIGPALAFGAVHALSAGLSVSPGVSWRAVLGLVAYGLIYVLLAQVLAAGVRPALAFRAFVLAAHVILAALAANWLADGARLWGYRLRYENTNAFALINLLLFPALLAGEGRRLILAEGAAVMWLSASRSGAAGLVAGLASMWHGPALGRYRWLLVALGLAVAVVIAARADFLWDNERWAMWRVAGSMWAGSPLIGQGPGTYKQFWLAGGPRAMSYGHAHNLPLTLAAEAGLAGLAAGAWLVVALVGALRRAGGPWALAALAATIALLIQSLADVPTTAPYITVTWLALLALGLAGEGSRLQSRGKVSPALTIGELQLRPAVALCPEHQAPEPAPEAMPANVEGHKGPHGRPEHAEPEQAQIGGEGFGHGTGRILTIWR